MATLPVPRTPSRVLPPEWDRVRRFGAPIVLSAVAILAIIVATQMWTDVANQAEVTAPTAVVGATLAIKVQVAGAVRTPGVYDLRSGDRIADAIRAAGGTTEEADDARLNLAQRVHDEQRLDVPSRRVEGQAPVATPVVIASERPATAPTTVARPATAPTAVVRSATAPTAVAPTAVPRTATVPTAAPDADLAALLTAGTTPDGRSRLDINRATIAELEKLPGIGVASAKRIAEFRASQGVIRSIADLREAGLTTAILRKALPWIAIG